MTRLTIIMENTQETERQASEWLARRDSANWAESDQARFEEWLNASAFNEVAFLRLESGWEEARRLKALGAGIDSDDPPQPGQWNLTPFFEQGRSVPAAIRERTSRQRQLVAIAASMIVAVAVAWRLWPAGDAYQTPVGGTASVPVSDGSKVTLNTDSRIRVTFTGTERRVELERGEAFFEVARDSKRPFVVTVSHRRVIALGTQFSVRRDADDIRVVVTEGKVRVEDDASRTKPILAAGSVARASDAGVWIEKGTVPEAQERLSWRSGVLMFRNQTLAEAVSEFNRYNARQIAIDDAAVANLKIEGNFRSTNVDAFARLLEEVYPVSVVQQESGEWRIVPR
jgi:transmembrane sensor